MQEIWKRRFFVFCESSNMISDHQRFDLDQVVLLFHREFISRIYLKISFWREICLFIPICAVWSLCPYRDICTVFFFSQGSWCFWQLTFLFPHGRLEPTNLQSTTISTLSSMNSLDFQTREIPDIGNLKPPFSCWKLYFLPIHVYFIASATFF